ncbi:hypothetical protein ACJDT4_03815 [Clostridium neuense]|uniref:Uncharacterized protein n=1 Tax=Clostridium neuense TaxID=1728934 RepID=A0ABW8TAN8_9CLOT
MISKFNKKSYKLPIAAVAIIIILGAIVAINSKNVGLAGKNSSTKTTEAKKTTDNKPTNNEKEADNVKNSEALNKTNQSENASAKSNNKNENENNRVPNAQKKANKIAKAENVSKANNQNESYYGNWHLSKILGTTPVTAMDEKQMQNCMGTKIKISKESFSDAINGVINNPKYVRRTVSADEFLSENKTSLKKLGIEGNSVQQIEVKSSNDVTQSLLYITSNGTMITEIDGVFFKIE